MNLRLPLLAAVAGGALAVPALPADAATFCVRTATCPAEGLTKTSIKSAVAAAAAADGSDEVRLGSGEFFEFVDVTAAGDLRIVGSGRGRTIITPENVGDGKAAVELDGASISDLAIRPRSNFNGTIAGLRLREGRAERIEVDADGNNGIVLDDAAVAEDVTVRASGSEQGVHAECRVRCVLRQARIEAALALRADDDSDLFAERISSFGTVGAEEGGRLTLERSMIVPMRSPALAAAAAGGALTLRHVTIAQRSGFDPDSFGVASLPHEGEPGSVVLEGVVIDGYGTAVVRRSDAGGTPVGLVARDSAWDRSKEELNPHLAGLGEVDVLDLFDRRLDFQNPVGGDFRPRSGNPLIDAVSGEAPPGFADFTGAPAADGDGDGVANPDIGAFEAGGVPRRPQPQPATPAQEPPAAPAAAASAPASAAMRALLDRTAPRLTGARLARRSPRLRRGGATRSTLLATLSEPATLRVQVQRRRGRRFVAVGRPFALIAQQGANRLAIRLPRRTGSLRLVVTATDAAGNRSAPKRLALRIR